MTLSRLGATTLLASTMAVIGAGCAFTNTSETARFEFASLNANATAGVLAPSANDLELRTKTWKHAWHCNYLDQCDTEFSSSLYVFDKRNGKQIKWNRIEVFAKDACDASTEDRRNYKTVTDADAVSIGWPKKREGKWDKVSTLLVFYADWGNVTSRVRTQVCE